ncbi:MAG: SUMF1/EgtB/PvdO family nonheme iron enzyme [Verrucomicrobiota bacterium]
MIALLLDENGDDRTKLADALVETFDCTLFTSVSPNSALETANALDAVDVMIADIPAEGVDQVLDARTQIKDRFPNALVIFLTRNDLSSHYEKLAKEEAVFYKPLDNQSLFDWLDRVFPGKMKNSAATEPAAPNLDLTAPVQISPSSAAVAAASEPAQVPPPPPPPAPPVENAAEPAPAAEQPAPPAQPEPPAAPPAPPAPPATGGGDLPPPMPVGTVLGDYELLDFRNRGSTSDSFVALQRSVDRRVGLRMLRPDFLSSESAKEQFRAEAKAQATVSHQKIASVFEAIETDSALFYTQELIDGTSLADMAAAGQTLEEEELLGVVKSASQAYSYLYDAELAYLPIWPEHIFVCEDGSVRLGNTVQMDKPENRVRQSEQIKNLAKSCHPVMDDDTKINETIPTLFYEMAGTAEDSDGIESWSDLLSEIKYIENQWKELSGGITPKRAAIYMGGVMGALVVLLGVIALGAQLFKAATKSKVRIQEQMVRIPAGPFVYQDGITSETGEFWIDAYEVTVAQYAEFLNHVNLLDEQLRKKYDHADQPSYKSSHMPAGWNTFYKYAQEGRKWPIVDGEETYFIDVDLNSPMVMVDWWDAYAYATWKGRRLPTEQEWEKAARGRKGNIYPWGDEMDFSKLNSGIDYVAPGEKKRTETGGEDSPENDESMEPSMEGGMEASMDGMDSMEGGSMDMQGGGMGMQGGMTEAADAKPAETMEEAPEESEPVAPTDGEPVEEKKRAPQRDGFNFWCGVDVMEEDISPYRIFGMAGNVSEWTGTWEPHPNDPSKQVPIRRGGSFRDKNQLELSTRRFAKEAGEWTLYVGFRTASDSAPVVAEAE